MTAEPINREKAFNAGVSIGSGVKKMVIPISSGTPSGAGQGWVWIDTAGTISLAFHDGTNPILIPITGATTEAIQDIVGAWLGADLGDIVGTYDDAGNLIGFVVDSGVITNAKLATMPTMTMKGNVTGGTAAPVDLTPAQVRAFEGLAANDTSTLDLSYSATTGVLTGVVLDSPTVGGMSASALQTAVINAISNGAGAAYDTLVEIQALLQADDTADALIVTAMGIRARFAALAVPSGSPTATLTHSLGLTNIHDYTIKVFVSATGAEEEYAHAGVSGGNAILLTDETGANIPTGRRAFITAGV